MLYFLCLISNFFLYEPVCRLRGCRRRLTRDLAPHTWGVYPWYQEWLLATFTMADTIDPTLWSLGGRLLQARKFGLLLTVAKLCGSQSQLIQSTAASHPTRHESHGVLGLKCTLRDVLSWISLFFISPRSSPPWSIVSVGNSNKVRCIWMCGFLSWTLLSHGNTLLVGWIECWCVWGEEGDWRLRT